jgi:hypothetical protein
MLRQGVPVLPEQPLLGWRRPYCAWSAVLAAVFFGREIWTTVLTVHKSWFSWGSFCICTPAWRLTFVISAGVALMVGCPATVIWCFSRSRCHPKSLNYNAPDGAWGVGDYVLFLQTWAVTILVVVLLGIVIWLDLTVTGSGFSPPYLLPIGVLAGSALWIGARLIWNAIQIRLQYRSQLRELGKTWTEIQEKRPPADPTINFLGEHWWKLPATVVGALTALWAITNWLLTSKLAGPR